MSFLILIHVRLKINFIHLHISQGINWKPNFHFDYKHATNKTEQAVIEKWSNNVS